MPESSALNPAPISISGRDVAPDGDAALRRRVDPREHAQERALARAVGADDPDPLAAVETERDAPERPEFRRRLGRLAAEDQVERGLLERVLLVVIAEEPERDVVQLDQRAGREASDRSARRRSESENQLVFVAT